MIAALIARDVRRAFGSAAWLPIAFFLLVATLVPFAIGPDARLLGRAVKRELIEHAVGAVGLDQPFDRQQRGGQRGDP